MHAASAWEGSSSDLDFRSIIGNGSADEGGPLDGEAPNGGTVGQAGRKVPIRHWMLRWDDLVSDFRKLQQARARARSNKPLEPLPPLELLDRAAEGVLDEAERARRIRAFTVGVLGALRDWAFAQSAFESDRACQAIVAWADMVEHGHDETHLLEYWQKERRSLFFAIGGARGKKALSERLWKGGTGAPSGYYVSAGDGLRRIVIAFDAAFGALAPPTDDIEHWRQLVLDLLPESLALKLHVDPKRAATVAPATRETLEPDLMSVQRQVVPRLKGAIEGRRPMLVCAPPGAGKTAIARIALAHALYMQPGTKALLLLPSKALVQENFHSWLDWQGDAVNWSVVPGSRDYPEYTRRLANGDFDLAICIYETAANLLASPLGSRTVLARTSLIVVDELQTLNDDSRGPRLEGLLTLLRRTAAPPSIVALSPLLTHRSRAEIGSWLGAAPEDTIHNAERPVPVTFHVLDGKHDHARTERTRPSERQEPGGVTELNLRDVRWSHAADALVKTRSDRAAAPSEHRRDVIALVCRLVVEDAQRGQARDAEPARILCFVRSRDAAPELARGIFAALNEQPSLLKMAPPRGRGPAVNPWTSGRWRDPRMTEREAAANMRDFERAGFGRRERTRVLEMLRHGVAYHSASLNGPARRLIEKEFSDGLVRVLVATDTLAEGVNLPASHVVIADLHESNSSGKRQPISVTRLHQRAGRAGRYRKRDAGHAYLLIDGALRTDSALDPDAAQILGDRERAFRHYVQDAPEGLDITSQLRDLDAVALLVLQALAAERITLNREDAIEKVRTILSATLMYHLSDADGRDLQEAQATRVLRELEKRRIISTAPDDGEEDSPDLWIDENLSKSDQVLHHLESMNVVGPRGDAVGEELLHVTPLGYTMARAALPIRTTGLLERLADAKLSGASPTSLLYLAASAPSLASGQWIKWSYAIEKNDRRRSELAEKIRRYATAYASPSSEQRRRAFAALTVEDFDPETRTTVRIEPGDLLTAPPSFATGDPLRWLMTRASTTELATAGRAKHLLRACVSHEWQLGEPVEHIELRLRRAFTPEGRGAVAGRSGEEERFPIRWSLADLQQLEDQIAHVLRAAAGLIHDVPRDQIHHYREMTELAERCSSGLPPAAAALLRLRVPGLDRETLTPLTYKPQPNDRLDEMLEHLDVAPEVKEDARRLIAEKRQRDAQIADAPPLYLRDEVLPDRSKGYDQAWHDMHSADTAVEAAQQLGDVLFAHALEADEPGEPTVPDCAMFEVRAPSRSAVVGVTIEPLDRRLVDTLIPICDIVVPLGGLTDVVAMREHEGWLRRPADLLTSLHAAFVGLEPDGDFPSDAMWAMLGASPPLN